jgi:hypothetical protein
MVPKLATSRLLSSVVIGAGLLVVAGIGGFAGNGVTFNACQNIYTGAVRMLPSSLPAPYNTTCNTTTTNKLLKEQAISWNQVGPQGPQGAAGPAGGLSAISEITTSTSFQIPAGVSHLMVEAWGGGGGGSSVNGCQAGNGGGSGGYIRGVIAVTPGESLAIVVGTGGAAGSPGSATSVQRSATALVSADGGAPGGLTSGGAGGAASANGIVRAGNTGGDGMFDPMCQFSGMPFFAAQPGSGGVPMQGTVATLNASSAGGTGGGTSAAPQGQPGSPGEVILSW